MMAGRLRRWTLFVKIGLRALLAPAQDPRQTFVSADQRQRELLANVELALTNIVAAKQRLAAKMTEVQAKLPQLREQARKSLAAGREDVARLALQRRQVAVIELQTIADQVCEVEEAEERLLLAEQRLATRIDAFNARQEVIAARYSAAEAQVRINEALGGVSQELADLGRSLEQAEEKAERMQVRASAIDGLIETGVLGVPGFQAGDSIDWQLVQIDVDRAVEDQLAELKRQKPASENCR